MVKKPRVYVWFVFFSLFIFLLFWGEKICTFYGYLCIFYCILIFVLGFSFFFFLFMGWKGVVCVSALFVDFGFNNSSFC
jgi:hypothetical protein